MAREYLESIRRSRASPTCTLQTQVIEGNDAAAVIVDTAEAEAVDLIAMSTHGRTGLKRWVYGSVTEKVLRGARCSMLIIRPAAHYLN